MGRIKARTAIKRYSKCGYAPILSGQAVFVETFEIFTYIYRQICTGRSGRQLSNNLFLHLP